MQFGPIGQFALPGSYRERSQQVSLECMQFRPGSYRHNQGPCRTPIPANLAALRSSLDCSVTIPRTATLPLAKRSKPGRSLEDSFIQGRTSSGTQQIAARGVDTPAGCTSFCSADLVWSACLSLTQLLAPSVTFVPCLFHAPESRIQKAVSLSLSTASASPLPSFQLSTHLVAVHWSGFAVPTLLTIHMHACRPACALRCCSPVQPCC